MILFDAGGGIRTRDFGDAPSDQHHEDYEPRTLTRLSYPGAQYSILDRGVFRGYIDVYGLSACSSRVLWDLRNFSK